MIKYVLQLIIISSPWGWLTEAINVHERPGGAQRPGDGQKQSGEVAQRRHWDRPRPLGTLSPTYPLGTSSVEMAPGGHQWPGKHGGPVSGRATTGKVLGRSPDDTQGPKPDPLALSRPVISFEPRGLTQRPCLVL